MNRLQFIVLLSISVILSGSLVQSEVPYMINYQGRLTDDSGIPLDTVVSLTFTIFSDTTVGSTELWQETHPSVTVQKGLFHVCLDSVLPIPNTVFDGSIRGLGFQVGSGSVSDTLIPLISIPYAYRANYADTAGAVADIGLISRNQVQDTDAVFNAPNRFYEENQFHNATHFYKTSLFHSNVTVDNGTFQLFDSTFNANANDIGIRVPLNIGSNIHISFPFSRKGISCYMENTGSGSFTGVFGKTTRSTSAGTVYGAYGLYGLSVNNGNYGNTYGVYAEASGGEYPYGIYAKATANGGTSSYGIYAEATGGQVYNFAGYFVGDVAIKGELYFIVAKYKIDHPQDPANKYLEHSFVASPEMKNVYDGTVVTDAIGLAVVNLPDYFESLNRDFRYQLTGIGDFAQAIVSREIAHNQFVIKTSKPHVKVSWQVTGIRNDPYGMNIQTVL